MSIRETKPKSKIAGDQEALKSVVNHSYWLPFAVVGIGIALLGTAAIRFFWFYKGASLLGPSATCLAAGVAGYVALKGIVTWSDQIALRRFDKSQEATQQYMEASMLHIEDIVIGSTTDKQVPGRLAMVLRGSDEGVESAYAFTRSVAAAAGSKVGEPLTDIHHGYGNLMLDLRKELWPDTRMTAGMLVRTVFVK